MSDFIYPDLGKQKHDDIQALNHAKFKMDYHRFCMITWENCIKYAVEIIDIQCYDTPLPDMTDPEDPVFQEVCRVSEKIFDFLEHKADEMFEKRFKYLEQDAKGIKPNNAKKFEEKYGVLSSG